MTQAQTAKLATHGGSTLNGGTITMQNHTASSARLECDPRYPERFLRGHRLRIRWGEFVDQFECLTCGVVVGASPFPEQGAAQRTSRVALDGMGSCRPVTCRGEGAMEVPEGGQPLGPNAG